VSPDHTPGPWDYVPGNENHGPYVTTDFGSTVADFYVMSREPAFAVNHESKPVPFMAEMAESNARLTAAAPDLLKALHWLLDEVIGDEPEASMKIAGKSGSFINGVMVARDAIAKATGAAQ
jgi:hypothetical protein